MQGPESNVNIVIGLFFRFCLRLRQCSFHLIVSDGVISRINVLLPTPCVSVGLIFTRSYHSTLLIKTSTTTPSLVKKPTFRNEPLGYNWCLGNLISNPDLTLFYSEMSLPPGRGRSGFEIIGNLQPSFQSLSPDPGPQTRVKALGMRLGTCWVLIFLSCCLLSFLLQIKDLIRKMLTANVRERITLTEVLEHPWLKDFETSTANPHVSGSV